MHHVMIYIQRCAGRLSLAYYILIEKKKPFCISCIISFERDFMWNMARDTELRGYHV